LDNDSLFALDATTGAGRCRAVARGRPERVVRGAGPRRRGRVALRACRRSRGSTPGDRPCPAETLRRPDEGPRRVRDAPYQWARSVVYAARGGS